MAEIVLLEERGIPISYIDGIGLYGLIVTGDLLPLQLESGKIYTVVWNGTRHTRTAIEMSVMGMTGVAVGNAAIVGGEADPENLDFFLFTVPADGRVGVLTPTEATTATVGLYEVIEEESLILKNPQGNDAKYPMKQMIRLNTTKGTKIYSKGEAIENVAVTLDLTSGDQTINAPDGYLVKSAVIKKPEDAQPENILKNKNIGGIVGELEMPEKITATIDPDFSEGDMVVTPDAGKVFSGVTVIKPANLVPENIAKNKVVAGIVGTHEGGGSGGGDIGSGNFVVTVVDYDGTVLMKKRANAGDVISLQPPQHERLVFDGWMASTEVIDNTVTVSTGDIMVYPTYYTASGALEIDVFINQTSGKTFKMYSVSSFTSVDWGDGTTDALKEHSYADYGEYTIKVYGMTYFPSRSTTNDYGVFYQRSAGNENQSVIGLYFPDGFKYIGDRSLWYCIALRYVAFSNSMTSIGRDAVRNCYCLEAVIFTKNLKTIASNSFYSSDALKTIAFAEGTTTIEGYTFQASSAINLVDCSALTRVPTLGGTNAFSSIHGATKILVKNSLYTQWIAATNWSSLKKNIVAV